MNEDKVVMGHIYVLLFPSGKRYVGQTIQTIEKRMWCHWHPTKKEVDLLVHRAMKKYGKKNTAIEKVFTLRCTQEYLDLIEQRTIKYYNTLSPNGYNLTEGGGGGAISEETRIKISKAHKGKPGTMKGRYHSDETKAKMKESRNSQEYKAKRRGRSPWNKGKHHSKETKAKISATRTGQFLSKETKGKMSASKKGKPWTLARRLSHGRETQ